MTIKVTYNVTDVYMSQSVSPVYITVSYSDGSSSGGGVWGTITGTLSNQTDLQNALNAKVPYSGATGDVSLGEYGINVGNVIYDTTPTGIPTEQGATYWDADAETVALIMNGTIQKIGEDTFYHVRNTTGSTIAKGTAVRFSGTTGNSGRLLIAPMLANGTYPSQYYMGITSEEIANNQDGKVYHFGKMRGVNTSAFADGDVLYVSSLVAGALTATAPVAPNNIIVAAAVVHAANNGTLMIRTTLGSNINADEGVLLTTPTANQGLFYDSGLWVNKSITTALGYTPVPTTRNITINGVTYDLSADRTYTISTGISGSGAAGQVTYWTGASAVSGSNNLFWDNTNGRLGIGTNAPANSLHIVKNANSVERVQIVNSSTGSSAIAMFDGKNSADSFQMGIVSSTYVNSLNVLSPNDVFLQANTSGNLVFSTINSTHIRFAVGVSAGGGERMRLFSTGNLVLQNGGTFSDGGQRLQVIGDTLLRGSGATSATTALTVQNSSSTNLLRVLNNGNVSFGADAMFWDNANGRLGIGTNAPAYTFDIPANNTNNIQYRVGTFQIQSYGLNNGFLSDNMYFNGTSWTRTTTGFGYGFQFYNGQLMLHGASTSSGIFTQNVKFKFDYEGAFVIGNNLNVTQGNYSGATALFTKTGNLILNSPTLDGGQRFQVYGDTLLRGSGATSATTALTVQNSSSTNLFTVRNDGRVGIATNAPTAALDVWNATDNAQLRISDSRVPIPNYSSVGFSPVTGTNTLGFFSPWSSITGGTQFSGFTSNTNSGTPFAFTGYHGGTSPTTAALRFIAFKHDGSTNRTALTGSEIIAGFSAGFNADVFQVKANGRINMSSLPTSATGLLAGDLWNDAGTIKIV